MGRFSPNLDGVQPTSRGAVSATIVSLLLFCSVLAEGVRVGMRDARPVITALHPSTGPTSGGFRIDVYGRELAYLESDILAFMGENSCRDPKVLVGWEKFSIEVPPCPGCGATRFNTIIMGQRSNFIDFLYTDECNGPTGDPSVQPIVPARWSQRENCTVCTELVHLTVSTLRDNFKYQSILETMPFVCNSMHLRNFSSPASPRCREDYNTPCRILIESRATRLANYIWDNWEKHYLAGRLPLWACREVQYCDPHIDAPPLPPGADD